MSTAATAALLNCHGYYQQFLSAVEAAISKLAGPVEKEFKVRVLTFEVYHDDEVCVCVCVCTGILENLTLE